MYRDDCSCNVLVRRQEPLLLFRRGALLMLVPALSAAPAGGSSFVDSVSETRGGVRGCNDRRPNPNELDVLVVVFVVFDVF